MFDVLCACAVPQISTLIAPPESCRSTMVQQLTEMVERPNLELDVTSSFGLSASSIPTRRLLMEKARRLSFAHLACPTACRCLLFTSRQHMSVQFCDISGLVSTDIYCATFSAPTPPRLVPVDDS